MGVGNNVYNIFIIDYFYRTKKRYEVVYEKFNIMALKWKKIGILLVFSLFFIPIIIISVIGLLL